MADVKRPGAEFGAYSYFPLSTRAQTSIPDSWWNTCSTPTWDHHGELIYFNSGAGIDPGQFKRWSDVGEEVSLSGHLSMYTIQLPLYAKAKIGISPQIKLYVMGGGFVTHALKGEMFERLSLPGENPLKLKWSLYDHKVTGTRPISTCNNAGMRAWQPKRVWKPQTE